MRWCLLTVLCVVTCLGLRALGDEPFQVVQRSVEAAGDCEFKVGLAYAPTGTHGIGVDDRGFPYSYTCYTEDWQAGLSLGFQLTEASKVGFSLGERVTNAREQREYASGEINALANRERDFSYAVSHEWRIAEDTAWDPRVVISVGHPWTGEVSGSVSILRDPVVLVGELRVLTQNAVPHDWLDLSLGAGFVANAAISLSTSAHFMVPRSGVSLPVTTLGMRVSYSLDASSGRKLAINVSLQLEGKAPTLSVHAEASWSGS